MDKFRPDISDDSYKGSRPFILKAFNKKCAYCESAIAPTLVNGDVEHHRPKRAVKTYVCSNRAPESLAFVLSSFKDLSGTAHGGYFWLAYNIENLLPSCPACNQYEKKNYFPVSGHRRLNCDESPDSEIENAMLVNPYFDDPNDHLAFNDPHGVVRPLSLRGAISIDVYGLNREGLPEARAKVMRDARLEFDDWYRALIDNDRNKSAEKEVILNRYESGEEPYSAAALTQIGTLQELLLQQGLIFSRRRGIWPSVLKSQLLIP